MNLPQVVPYVVVLMNMAFALLLKSERKRLATWGINKGRDTIKVDSQVSSKVLKTNKDSGDHTLGGPSNRLPQQGSNIFQRTTKLKETLTQFMQVTMSNHKSTESSLKNLEIQVGQLAKQLAEKSSNSFGENTEKNPKEECNVVMTRKKKRLVVENEDKVALEKQIVERMKEEVTDVTSQESEKPIMVEEKEINDQEKEIEVEKEKENEEKVEKNKGERKEKRKTRARADDIPSSSTPTPPSTSAGPDAQSSQITTTILQSLFQG
ncbi:hypothetical protein HKD37_10G028271 [Glycine soja]